MNAAYNFPCLYALLAPINDKKIDDCMLKIIQDFKDQ